MRVFNTSVAVLACSAVILASSAAYSNGINVVSLSANYLDSSYAGTTLLVVADNADIVTEFGNGSQYTYQGGSFSMTTQLAAGGDQTVGTKAMGLFEGGTLVVKDGSDTDLLLATLESLFLEEVGDNLGLFQGSADFIVTGGTLADQFPGSEGDLVQIVFNMSSGIIDDFATPFSGYSNVTLMPIPEPGTLFLAGTGILVMLGWLRRRKLH